LLRNLLHTLHIRLHKCLIMLHALLELFEHHSCHGVPIL
jgi:hypothetical protein